MKKEVEQIEAYLRAANYLSAIQIFLKGNYLLKEKLMVNDIKEVLLGHWGTCPGINLVYAHLNNLIRKHGCQIMYVIGPGHGFPALQANLFLEGSLEKFYPKAKHSYDGIGYITKNFSWPYGFPSHSNPGAPGVILEGGELGYSLSTSYGTVLDNPNLIVACLVGDGEAETGPTATAWHLNKFVDPATNGAVLPILHLNGYKISGPTIFGRMSDKELKSLFYGYGYEPIIVQPQNIHNKMISALEYSYKKIRSIQKKARSKTVVSPRFPMIILRTPKGWTGIKELHGEKIEGNCLSHQVVTKNVRKDLGELNALEEWLKSYKFNEIFNEEGFSEEILNLIPKQDLKMGLNKHAFPKYNPLKLPDIRKFAEPVPQPGTIGSSSMRRAGEYLNEVFKLNKKTFRLMSPDETYSNKLDEVFQTTSRAFVWPIQPWDKDLKPNGRVMEMLSEHSLQGLAQGYTLTGRHCIFASYAAFVDIVSSMEAQYEKFLRVATEIPWRSDVPSFNYILTSSGWRQQHNGFSHQNPSFISGILEKPGSISRAYFPADGSSMLVTLNSCLKSKNRINVIIAGKTVEPRWLTIKEAEKELRDGIMTWEFASDKNPDLVFIGVGDYTTKEALATIDLIKREAPEVKLRFVNIIEITALGLGNKAKGDINYENYLTHDKPVIINYHGYPTDMESLLLAQKNQHRFRIHGYKEHGSTTTPFDMHVRNETDRYNLAIEAFSLLSGKAINKSKANKLISKYKQKLVDHNKYIRKYGIDPDEIRWWKWQRN